MSGWPGLNLRNFMAHLAPGIYFSLQIAIALLFAAWLVDPPILGSVAGINEMRSPLGACLGLVLLTVCYFIGIVHRLPTVDHVDVWSLDYRLRWELWTAQTESARCWWSRGCFSLRSYLWFLCRFTWELLPTPWQDTTVRDARKYMEQPSRELKRLRELLRDWHKRKLKPNQENRKPDQSLRVAVMQYAMDTLVDAGVLTWTPNGELAAASASTVCSRLDHWVSDDKVVGRERWFAVCDSYPYPIRLLYRSWSRANAARRRELAEHYVPLILETIISKWPNVRYTHGPINRAKVCVIADRDHESLGAFVYEREALTRMPAGFLPALRFGFCASLLIAIVCVVWLVLGRAGWVSAPPTHTGQLALGFATLVVWNGWLSARVLANLRPIRFGEVDAVLEAYLTCLTQRRTQR